MQKTNFDEVLKNIQKALKEIERENHISEKEFRRKILEDIFLKEMGYEEHLSLSERKQKDIRVENQLLIKITVEENLDKQISIFSAELHIEQEIKWGILLGDKGIWLLNRDTEPSDELFRRDKIVLEIIFGKNTDQKYFTYFTYDNTIGQHQNALFFRDIIIYKNNFYKGNEKSWRLYHSTLKRFFNFYVEKRRNYKENIYDEIKKSDFEEYISTTTRIATINSRKNAFFYFKDFMKAMSDKDIFDVCSNEVIGRFADKANTTEFADIMDQQKLKKAIIFLGKGRNKERDVALFLTLLSFGVERRKLCLLQWKSNVNLSTGYFELDGNRFAMPSRLKEAMECLRGKEMSSRYVFYNGGKHKDEPIKEGTVNDVLGKLMEIDPEDPFYKNLTPANIRRCLVKHLLYSGYSLEKIIFLMGIELYNLGSYITKDDIKKVTANEKTSIHPMELYLENI